MKIPSFGALAVLVVLGAAPSGASAATLLSTTVSSAKAEARTCHASLADGAGVAQRRVHMPASGVVSARLTAAAGDWDVAIFDALNRTSVAGAAGFGSDELASGFAGGGRDLIVQACRRSGPASQANIVVSSVPVPAGTADQKPTLAKVYVANASQKSMLGELGFDVTEHAGEDFVEVVLYGDKDRARMRNLGFRYDVVVDDLVKADSVAAAASRRVSTRAAAAEGILPSGRSAKTGYRHLADYDADLKKLVEANPGLVRPIVLKNKTLEGREVKGIEITKDVDNLDDGKPIFFQMGVHHAREWPSAEHAIESAFEMINAYGKDPKVTDLLSRSRMIVVPVINPDGFNVTREAPVDLVNNPNYQQIPDANPVIGNDSAAYLVDPANNYKRRNCRLAPSQPSSPPGLCATPAFRASGVDPNRNYGGLWGGPGASALPLYDTYRGQDPFSEAESLNVRDLVSNRGVTTLITNHTFSNLVLRAPGVKAQGQPIDEPAMADLGARMAAKNGYINQPSYALYDTTGTTEDWTYLTAGAFGYTFEIGPGDKPPEKGGGFHPPYEFTIQQYEQGANNGGGNRAAYLLALENTADPAKHSTLTGSAPEGATLRVKREFATETSPVEPAQTNVVNAPSPAGPRQTFPDTLQTTIKPKGAFSWAINPSTRPVLDGRNFPGVADKPIRELNFKNKQTTKTGDSEDVPFNVTDADAAAVLSVIVDPDLPSDDYDIQLFRKEGAELKLVGSSGKNPGETEQIDIAQPPVGDYVLRVNNFLAFGPWTGKVSLLALGPNTFEPRRATEAWTLTCEAGEKIISSQKVTIERGQKLDVAEPCGANAKAVVAAAVAEKAGAVAKPVCASSAGFASADLKVQAKGRRVRFDFARRVPAPVSIEVFQSSKGRQILGERRVARFAGLTKSFTWSGVGNDGKKITDGYFFVRYRVKGARTRTDFRRFTLQRTKGRFASRRTFYRPDSCGLLASAKLERPVFGGRTNRPLNIAFRLARASTVTVQVRKGKRVVRTFTTRRAAGQTHRIRVTSKKLPRGEYRVTISARAGKGTGTGTLVGRRL